MMVAVNLSQPTMSFFTKASIKIFLSCCTMFVALLAFLEVVVRSSGMQHSVGGIVDDRLML